MKQRVFDPTLYTIRGGELSLSGVALAQLMREVLAKGVSFRFRARGWSMMPFILDGDVISISPLSGRPGLGQVVAFIRPSDNQLAVHRVVGHRGSACLLQGDSGPEVDGLVPHTAILGCVTSVERDGRHIRLGLGVERFAIALLQRRNLLQRSVYCLSRFLWRLRGGACLLMSYSSTLFRRG